MRARQKVMRARQTVTRPRRGFTLLEVLVGLAVASLALTAGFAALSFIGDRSSAAEADAQVALSGATARELLVDWVSNARLQAPNNGGGFQGVNGEDQGLTSDELDFPTTAVTPLHVRNSMVRLYIDTDPDTPEYGLVAELKQREQDDPRRVELVPQAAGLEIRYLPDVAQTLEWEESWEGQNALPRAVELTLTPAAGDSLPLLLRYPIRVTLATLR